MAGAFKDAEDPTFSGKAVAWLAAGIGTFDKKNTTQYVGTLSAE